MASYGENFRAGKAFTICPLCNLHFDSQFLCTQCPVIRNEIGTQERISDLFTDQVSKLTAKTLHKVMENTRKVNSEVTVML